MLELSGMIKHQELGMTLKHTFILLVLICLFGYRIECHAGFRTYTFKHLTENIALKQSHVNCIYQDKKGLMHFGTNEGLFLYDGHQSILYWNPSRVGSELASNNIHSISEIDASTRLLSTSDGLYVFDVNKRQFSPVERDDNWIEQVDVFRSDSSFYFVSGSGFGQLEITKVNNHYQAICHQQDDGVKQWLNGKSLNIRCHYQGSSDKIILATGDRQMFSWDLLTNRIEREGIQGHQIMCLFEDSHGQLWAGADDNQVYRWNPDNEEIQTIRLKINRDSYGLQKYISTISEDREGNILIGSNNNGLAIIRAMHKYNNNPTIEYYTSEPENSNSICDNNVSCLFCDRSNTIFIGTQGNGVNQLSLGQGCFTQHIVRDNNPNSLDHIRVNAIHDDNKGSIWFGTRLGLNRFDRATNRYYRYHNIFPGDNNIRPSEVDSIGETVCFCEDSVGNLWIGSYGTGLFVYNDLEQRFYQFKDVEGRYVPTSRITDVTTDRQGKLWIATHGAGMACVDSVDWTNQDLYLRFFKCDEAEPEGFSRQAVNVIYPDSKNNLWFSNRGNGLYRYNQDTDRMKQFKHVAGDSTTLSNDEVISICSDPNGDIWFGTARGLNKFDINEEYFTSYTMESGLPHNSICGVLSDEAGKIWLYTQRGIYRFNPLTETFDRFIENNRIFHEDYTIDATHKNKGGKLFLGTLSNGCFEFHPDSIKDNLFIPTVSLTDFKISGHSLLEVDNQEKSLHKPLDDIDELELSYLQNDLSIEFTAFTYHADLNIQLSYLMEGVDNEWITTNDTKELIPYTNLNPGKYTFKVRVKNNLRPDQSNEESITFLIRPPYWATTWAYALYIILIILTGTLLYRYAVSRLKLKNDLKIERMKLGFFTNISHEFRTPLTLIAGPLRKLMSEDELVDRERMNYYALMHKNTNKMLKLVNQILDIRKIDNRKMTLVAEELDIVAFAKEVFDSFNMIAQEREIGYHFNTDVASIRIWIDQDKMEKILYNLLSNAFKYSPDKSTITLSITHDSQKDEIQISVEDAGKGIPDNQLNRVFNRFHRVEDTSGFPVNGTGLGLSIVKTFVEMHSGNVKVVNNNGPGCTFILSLLMGDRHLSDTEKKKLTGNEITETSLSEENVQQSEEKGIPGESTKKADEQAPLVLIVEDNAEVRLFIEGELKHAYRIVTAANGKEGLEKAVETFPDLIVSDVMMPKMDGLEFCQAVKEDIRICHIPVVLLTARSSGDQQIEGIETGADAYITKPFDPAYLEARIRNLITSRLQLKEAFTKHNSQQPQVPKKMSNPLDDRFIENATSIVIRHMEDPEFSVPDFTMQMGMSNSVFYRKIKALTGLSAGEFIKHIRMEKALELLIENTYTIAEIANKVGFNDPKYFSTSFKKIYGKSPKQYLHDR